MPCERTEQRTPEATCPAGQPAPSSLTPPPSQPGSSALTCLQGSRQHSRRGLSSPLLPEVASALARSERKRDLGLFLLPLPPRTSAPPGRGANCNCHSLTLSNLRRYSDRQPLHRRRPTAPAPGAAEPEVRGPEVALSVALDGLSLPQSGQPSHVSMVPAHLPRGPLSRGAGPVPPTAALATTSGTQPAPLPG